MNWLENHVDKTNMCLLVQPNLVPTEGLPTPMFVASLPYAAWRAGFVGWLRSPAWCGGTLFPVHLAAFRTAELGVLIRQIRRHRHVLPLLDGVVRWFSDPLNFSGRTRYPRPGQKKGTDIHTPCDLLATAGYRSLFSLREIVS
mgnify:CR=1 FL=1